MHGGLSYERHCKTNGEVRTGAQLACGLRSAVTAFPLASDAHHSGTCWQPCRVRTTLLG